MINPRFIGILVGARLGLAWAIGVGDALVVLVLAVAGYAVALVLTRRGGRPEADAVSWRWPRTREARTDERRRREARREAAARVERAVPSERVSTDGSRSNGVRQPAR